MTSATLAGVGVGAAATSCRSSMLSMEAVISSANLGKADSAQARASRVARGHGTLGSRLRSKARGRGGVPEPMSEPTQMPVPSEPMIENSSEACKDAGSGGERSRGRHLDP